MGVEHTHETDFLPNDGPEIAKMFYAYTGENPRAEGTTEYFLQ
jgi:hypothetical protein